MRTPRPFPEGTVERMDDLLAGDLSRRARDRVQCIRLLALGRSADDVAEIVSWKPRTVYNRKREFLERGEQALLAAEWGGRRQATLTTGQEAELVEALTVKAARGALVTVKSVKDAVEQVAGRSVNRMVVYRLMWRHSWRKIVPRPSHPNADPERREAFKETSRD